MAIKDIANGRSDLYKVNPALIQMKDDWNSRDATDPANREHINMLKASIKEVGVKKPLVCFMENNQTYVTDGHCRLTAVMELIAEGLEIKAVPVIVEDKASNEADRIFSQIVHNAGKPLTVIEQGRVFKRLIALGWVQKDIAAKAGLSQGRVSQILDLQTLPPKLQQYIVEGKASANLVLALYKKHNGDVALVVAELEGAVATAEKEGRTKAKPSDTESGAAEKKEKGAAVGLKKLIKDIIEQAWEQGKVDDTEDEVTITMPEDAYAMLIEALGL
jgi:ParB family chromosome partitioning protein